MPRLKEEVEVAHRNGAACFGQLVHLGGYIAGGDWLEIDHVVTVEPSERITFKHLKGPLHYAWEEFVFNDVDGDTELVHSGEFIWHWLPVVGWLGGLVYTKPTFERAIEKHMRQIQATCEARASRSRVFSKRKVTQSD